MTCNVQSFFAVGVCSSPGDQVQYHLLHGRGLFSCAVGFGWGSKPTLSSAVSMMQSKFNDQITSNRFSRAKRATMRWRGVLPRSGIPTFAWKRGSDTTSIASANSNLASSSESVFVSSLSTSSAQSYSSLGADVLGGVIVIPSILVTSVYLSTISCAHFVATGTRPKDMPAPMSRTGAGTPGVSSDGKVCGICMELSDTGLDKRVMVLASWSGMKREQRTYCPAPFRNCHTAQ